MMEEDRPSRPSTPEFPHESNSMISSPRSGPSRPSTPTTSSSATAPPASTSSARACYRFFSSLLRGVYSSCVLPTETAFAASHSICSSTYSTHTAPNCAWRQLTFRPPPTVSLQRTFSLSSPFLALVSTAPGAPGAGGGAQAQTPKKRKQEAVEKEEEEEDAAPPKGEEKRLLRTMHIRLRLTAKQRKEVIKAFAVQRKAYNFAVELARTYGAHAKANRLRDAWAGWKDEVRHNRFGDSHLHRWLLTSGVHTKIDAQGIRQFVHACESGWAKAKAEGKPPGSAPLPGFRSARKANVETLFLEKGATGGPLLRFLPTPYVQRKGHGQCLLQMGGDHLTKSKLGFFLMEDKVAVIERLVGERTPRFDGKLRWDKRTDSFHFIYTYELPRLPDPDPLFAHKRIVATDPGVYPFQAWYSPTSGEHGRLLDGEADRLLKRLHDDIDVRQKRLARFQGGRTRTRRQRYRTRKRMRQRLAREQNRLGGWIKAAHYDCAHRLLRQHDLVLQPTLETARLSRRASRRIQSDTVRKMLTWSHYRFVQRLEAVSARYAGRHVIKCTEPGTSKTCTECGFWKADLRVRDKVYRCPRCKVVVDRQLAGARNNFFAAYGRAVGVGWDGVDG